MVTPSFHTQISLNSSTHSQQEAPLKLLEAHHKKEIAEMLLHLTDPQSDQAKPINLLLDLTLLHTTQEEQEFHHH
jgi:hypothetical protein